MKAEKIMILTAPQLVHVEELVDLCSNESDGGIQKRFCSGFYCSHSEQGIVGATSSND